MARTSSKQQDGFRSHCCWHAGQLWLEMRMALTGGLTTRFMHRCKLTALSNAWALQVSSSSGSSEAL
jgi:hypothetical protein